MSVNDSAVYTCKASNNSGEAITSTTLIANGGWGGLGELRGWENEGLGVWMDWGWGDGGMGGWGDGGMGG